MDQQIVDDVASELIGYVITGLVGAAACYVYIKLKVIMREIAAIKTGLTCELKAQIVEMHRRYVVVGEPCPVSETERMDETYHAYHDLGGNGTGTRLWQQFMDEAKVLGRTDWRHEHKNIDEKEEK